MFAGHYEVAHIEGYCCFWDLGGVVCVHCVQVLPEDHTLEYSGFHSSLVANSDTKSPLFKIISNHPACLLMLMVSSGYHVVDKTIAILNRRLF